MRLGAYLKVISLQNMVHWLRELDAVHSTFSLPWLVVIES